MIQIAFKDDEITMIFLHQLSTVPRANAKAIVSITHLMQKISDDTAEKYK
ncbi:MAG TPA: hypothetical protein O0X64_02025 [Methanocorpusculum sp.]|nr:hypothetical protein [Methanocorpusculum sp.]